jgi:hypothetical protein
MELVIAVVVILAVAAAVLAFTAGQRRGATGLRSRGPARVMRPRRTRAPRNDPMAQAVVRHSRALDPDDVVVEELRLKAEANRVAAEQSDDAGLAAEHRARADALEQRAAQADGRVS